MIRALFQIVLIIGMLFSVYSVEAANVCCERTVSGGSCEYVDDSLCVGGFGATPTSCDQVSYCKPVCCYDQEGDGYCYANYPKSACELAGGLVQEDSTCDTVSACDEGCCIIGTQAAYVTEVRCKAETAVFPDLEMDFRTDVASEAECLDIVRSAEQGCCVTSDNTCSYTTKGNCAEPLTDKTGFFSGKFCSQLDFCSCTPANPEFGGTADDSNTGCLESEDNVYWFDSCGNQEGLKEECDYGSGFLCGDSDENDEYTCENLNCFETSLSFEDYVGTDIDEVSESDVLNGESWCVFDSSDMDVSIEPGGKDPVGSRYYRSVCINGHEIVEPCADFRTEFCVSGTVDIIKKDDSEGKLTEARCVENVADKCSECNTADPYASTGESYEESMDIYQEALANDQYCCEDRAVRDCSWVGRCIPKVSPGFKFWEGEGTDICGTATAVCPVVVFCSGWNALLNTCDHSEVGGFFTGLIMGAAGAIISGLSMGIGTAATVAGWGSSAAIGGFMSGTVAALETGFRGWQFVSGKECLSEDYLQAVNNICRAQGDCGADFNFLDGKSLDGFIGYGELDEEAEYYNFLREELVKRNDGKDYLNLTEPSWEEGVDFFDTIHVAKDPSLKQKYLSFILTTIVGTIGYGAIGYGFGEADRSSKDALQRGGGPLGLLIGFAIPKEWGVSEAASAGVTDAATAAMAATEKKYTYNEDGSITDETGKVYKKDDPKYGNVYSDMIQTKDWDYPVIPTVPYKNNQVEISIENMIVDQIYAPPPNIQVAMGSLFFKNKEGTVFEKDKNNNYFVRSSTSTEFIPFDENIHSKVGFPQGFVTSIDSITGKALTTTPTSQSTITTEQVDSKLTTGVDVKDVPTTYIDENGKEQQGTYSGKVQKQSDGTLRAIGGFVKNTATGMVVSKIQGGVDSLIFGKADEITKPGVKSVIDQVANGLTQESIVNSANSFTNIMSSAFSALSWTQMIYGIVDLAAAQTEVIEITATCNPWVAPRDSEDECEKCNPKYYYDTDEEPTSYRAFLACSEYRCKSLGATCELLNQGTEEEVCDSVSKYDVNSPTIVPWIEAFDEDYRSFVKEVSGGFEVTQEYPIYQSIRVGIQTNEPSQCKMSFEHSTSYDEMGNYYFGGTNYNYFHQQLMVYPDTKNVTDGEFLELTKGGSEYQIFVRCVDPSGNSNEKDYVIKMHVSKEPDITAPVILSTSIGQEVFIGAGINNTEINVFMNEPGECRWNWIDQKYTDMPENNKCISSGSPDFLGNYPCLFSGAGDGNLGEGITSINLRAGQFKEIFIKCQDTAGNYNKESFKIKLKGSDPLLITNILPKGDIFTSERMYNITLMVQTDGGAYMNGQSICKFTEQETLKNNVQGMSTEFFVTGNASTHEQSLAIIPGQHTYYLGCYDDAGNTAYNQTVFSILADTTSPGIEHVYEDTSTSPSIIRVELNEDAFCQYSLENEISFGEGTDMIKDGNIHSVEGGYPKYFVTCKDVYGNEMNRIRIDII